MVSARASGCLVSRRLVIRTTRWPASCSAASRARSRSNAPVGVERVAVQLDDQTLLRPGRVDLEPGYEGVHARWRQAVGAAEGEEATLELRPGLGRVVVALVEERAERLQPPP